MKLRSHAPLVGNYSRRFSNRGKRLPRWFGAPANGVSVAAEKVVPTSFDPCYLRNMKLKSTRVLRGSWCAAAIVVATLSVGVATEEAAAQFEVVGTVKHLEGTAFVLRGTDEMPLEVGFALMSRDLVRTGPESALGLTLKDDARLSLGPESQFHLVDFDFEPASERLSLSLRILRGIASFVTGKIGQLAPESVRIETPTSIIGVRGTHVLIQVPSS